MKNKQVEMWRKAELEMERRWCTNVTEEINHSALVHTDHDLLVSVLDLRTVTCPHIETVFQLNCFPTSVSSPENVALSIFLC